MTFVRTSRFQLARCSGGSRASKTGRSCSTSGAARCRLMARDEDMEKLASAVNSLLRVSGARLDLTKVW